MNAVDAQIDSNTELGFAAWPEQFLLHWQHPAYHFGYRREPEADVRDAALWLSAADNRRVLLPDDLAKPCFNPRQVVIVGIAHRRTWVLADRTAVSGQCNTGGEPRRIVKYSPPTQL